MPAMSDHAIRAACLIGWPAAHSRSPLIHRYWLNSLGIVGDYRIEPVRPEAVADFVTHLADRGYVGCNVTIPHKESVLALAAPDARALSVGAANTLWFEDGVLRATNTDVEGFIGNLDASAPRWRRDGHALVLGAGGSSRAVLFGLLERGASRVYVANRTVARAQELATRFGGNVVALPWDRIADAMPRVQLLVNTTSLGMQGQGTLDVDLAVLPADAVVADLVYVPLVTPLLAAARARGLQTADGLGMLLHQAVRGFALWFGQVPEVTPALRALVERDLTGQDIRQGTTQDITQRITPS
jgi:shikimate dehydrogenase